MKQILLKVPKNDLNVTNELTTSPSTARPWKNVPSQVYEPPGNDHGTDLQFSQGGNHLKTKFD